MVPLLSVHVELVPEFTAAGGKDVSLGRTLGYNVDVILKWVLVMLLSSWADFAAREGLRIVGIL
jgi:hypothetical protein